MTRPQRAFWLLVGVAVLAAGVLSEALASRPNPATGILVAVSGTLLAVALTLALRILGRLEHCRPNRS